MAAMKTNGYLLCFCIVFLQVLSVKGACPQIISRADWGARDPTFAQRVHTPQNYAVIHHSSSPACTSRSTCAAAIKEIQDGHMDNIGWSDIGYNFAIGGDGSVYEGRGWGVQGAYTSGMASIPIGFVLIGDFTSELPPQNQLKATKDLLHCGVSLGQLTSNYHLKGHRDLGNTQCPGDRLYAEIQTWSHYA